MVAQTGLLMQTGLLKEEWELLRLGLHDLPSLDQKLLPLEARAFGVAMRIVMPIVFWSDLNQRRVVSLCANRLCPDDSIQHVTLITNMGEIKLDVPCCTMFLNVSLPENFGTSIQASQ